MRVLLVLSVFAASGCLERASVVERDAGQVGHQAPEALRACAGHPVSVSSVAAVVDALNALPKPVSVPCFVASLERPLSLVASRSFNSAQPAFTSKNPRLFLLGKALVISVVPDGVGAPLIEMGQWVTATRTLKAEILLPFDGALSHDAPFSRVKYSAASTSCAFCHRNETADAVVDGGFVSDAFRPTEDSLVSLANLRAEHDACTDAGFDGGTRCEYFHALFDFGAVEESAFGPEVDVFVH